MTAQIRQNIYGAWLDGDVTAMEALRSLCDDYEELDKAYKDYEGLREQTRDQIGNVLVKIGDKVEIKGFGTLTLMAPQIVEGFDKRALNDLIIQLIEDGYAPIAQQIAACKAKTSRTGGLRIEREKK